jgi:signal transduction histidine kinase
MASPSRWSERWPTFGRLRFSDELEPVFSGHYAEHSLPYARFAIVLAIVLYALFGILDLFIVPDVARSIWFIRYAIFCPIAVIVLATSFTPRFTGVMQPVLSALAALCGLGIVGMVAIADPSAGHLYYAGLLLVVPWTYTLLRVRFAYATVAAVTILIGYEIVAIWIKPTPLDIFVNNNFFFVSSVIIGMAAGYTIERGIRNDFLQRRLIESQRAELAEHNLHLDSALQDSLEEVRRQAAELQASRGRIVAAADAERRRIERNIHDGAQQQLVSLAVQLRLASTIADEDPARAKALLDDLQRRLQDAVDELRNLAHGIYPPLLMDQGLTAALTAAANRSTLPTRIEAASLGRYPTDVEASVYFCVLEAMQNASKHAGEGASVTVRVAEVADGLTFEVSDDGAGFDPHARGSGAGFVNMRDRIGALGGTVRIDSAPGAGTTVSGTVPAHEVGELSRQSGDVEGTVSSNGGEPAAHGQLRV